MRLHNPTQWTLWTLLAALIIIGFWAESGKAQQAQQRIYDSQVSAKYIGAVDDTLKGGERKYFYIAWPTVLNAADIDTTFNGINWRRHYADARWDGNATLAVRLDSLAGVTDSLKIWIAPVLPMIGTDGKEATAVIPINDRSWPNFSVSAPVMGTDSTKSIYNWTTGKDFSISIGGGLGKCVGMAIGFQNVDAARTARSRLRFTVTF